jgi:tetratricopeptide (TPR) repeat protein
LDRITRKSLKDDRFAAEVTHGVEFLGAHRRQTLLYGGIGAAVLAVALGIYFYRQNRQAAAHEALFKAMETYHAVVGEEETPGRINFKTDKEKYDKAFKDFEDVANKFSIFREGKVARYYLGLVQHEMGKKAEAQKRLEQVAGESHDDVSALARLALAEFYLAEGKDEEARKQYEYLVKNPTSTVPESRAQLAMARYLKGRNPEEARKLLLELIKRPGPASASAGALLRELGQQ